ALPYSVGFENAADSGRYINEVRVVTQLDADLDARSFKLGDIKIGDITIDVPDDRTLFTTQIDFTATRGFLLRVSAGIDLTQVHPTATWLLQAIDPLTGELLKDSTKGLLKPNDASGAGAGYVGYTVEAKSGLPTGSSISASARVLFDNAPPEDTEVITQLVDGTAPTTTLSATRIGTSDNFEVKWDVSDDAGGSGFKHVTLYVAKDGGDFKIWQLRLTEAAGSLVFTGEPGASYEFLALSTDVAGNRESPAAGVNAVSDGADVNLGGLPSVPSTTAANFGEPPAPVPTPSTNPLFVAAEANIPNTPPTTRLSEFDSVLAPFVAQAFATGIPASESGIGPMAIVETADGSFLISGGANRGQIFAFGSEGGTAGLIPWASLEEPVFNLAFDADGDLWATTGGGALLQLDGATGAVVNRFGDGLTMGLAIDPATGRIYVGANTGVLVFDPTTGEFTQFSRDRNLRVASLAFDNDGELWGVTWPDRRQVVRFTDRARAETMLRFDSDIDSLAFGQEGTPLQGLLFVSHNSGRVSDLGTAAVGSELTMVDVATLRQVALAKGGSRGDNVFATSDGRVLLSQSNQVDVVNPVYAPSVVATNPPNASAVALPLPFISVTFDQDMFDGAASLAESVLNLSNYALVGATTGEQILQGAVYDEATRTVLLTLPALLSDSYTLTVEKSLVSIFGQKLAADYVTTFKAASDLTSLVDIDFGLTRYDREHGTISYDVTLTNIGDTPLILPVLLTLDPRAGYPGVPSGAAGRTDDGRWMIDLSSTLPAGGRLDPGETTTGRTISIATPDRRRVDFTASVLATALPNHAPVFTTTPPATAAVGTPFTYDANADDADGNPVFYGLASGPESMTVDVNTGVVTWTPPAASALLTPVVLQAIDSRGAITLQRFVLEVTGGNREPRFLGLASEIAGREGTKVEFSVVAGDADDDRLTFWADTLPAGATFDPSTRSFVWTPGFDQAGTYELRFFVSDGKSITAASTTLLIAEGRQPPVLVKPADRTSREGDDIRFFLKATGEPGATLTYLAD
ncbi:MAG: APHP domain-containing protein, partial [Alphaproteobacteria bacterium]|nr:APHP domain-containing protein [Alphaproteobacteria bacterium]